MLSLPMYLQPLLGSGEFICLSLSVQWVPKAQGWLPVPNNVCEIRAIHFIKLGKFLFQVWSIIWIHVHLNMKNRSRMQFKETHLFKMLDIWTVSKGFSFVLMGNLPKLICSQGFCFSNPSPPKLALLDKPPSESHWYWWKLNEWHWCGKR